MKDNAGFDRRARIYMEDDMWAWSEEFSSNQQKGNVRVSRGTYLFEMRHYELLIACAWFILTDFLRCCATTHN
jgi:hypothetical protein